MYRFLLHYKLIVCFILTFYFALFCIINVAELDVLTSLSVAGDYFDGPSCRPVVMDISNSSDKKVPFISGKRLGHPLLHTRHLKKGSFVSNDVHIGGAEHPKFIILTSPNMGGKSTLLRQVLLAVILA